MITVDTDKVGLIVEGCSDVTEEVAEILRREDIGDTIVTLGTNDTLVLLPVNVFIPLLIKLVVSEVRNG